jgi:L-malate glycosyltransferase
VKPNILQLIGSFQQGGSERQAVQLTRLLIESGRYRVYVACLDRNGPLRGEVERIAGTTVAEFKLTSFYDANAARQWRRFHAFLKREKIDVVHTHDFYTNVFGIPAAAVARVPLRVASRRHTDGTCTDTQKAVERGVFRLAHAVVANAAAVHRQLVAEGVAGEKIVTLYNGLDRERVAVDPMLSREELLSRLGLPLAPERRFVAIVANLHSEVKDHATFLRAARRVRAEVPDAAFVLAGEGRLMEQTRALAGTLGLARDVHFTGSCARPGELLAIADVCVLSSKAEGFSNSILEYMAASRPVVATDVGGAREVVVEGETGYLVRPGDDETMADRIAALLANPSLAREIGAKGRGLVEREFSCEAQLERTEALYKRMLTRSTWRARPATEALRGEEV